MIRRSFTMFSAVALVALAQAMPAAAQESRPSSEYQDDEERYSGEELDNLVSSVALYPDALLAQVLVAATFPDQIEDAARYVRSNGTSGIDDQSWDVSVKSVAHYASALNMMADKIDWTTALGRAYASQSSDVMSAVQRMRRMADEQGNLRSNEQQQVSRDDDYYVIAPAQPRVIYVPVYDPYVIYTRPVFGLGYSSRFWSFGIGFPIGGWLSYDVNWRTRSVYYNGWDSGYFGWAGGWRARSRPYIHITNIYVNPRYRNVYINRDVIRRRVVYRNVDRYPGVHRDTRFAHRDAGYRGGPERSRYDIPRNTPDRGRSDGRDARGNDRRDDGGRYNGSSAPTRPNDSNRNRDSRPTSQRDGDRGGWNPGGSRVSRPAQQPENNRGGWNQGNDRDVNRAGTWGRDRSRDGSSSGQSSSQRDGPRRDPRPEMGAPDRTRNESRSGGRGRSPDEARAPRGRSEQPMINPRRAEGQSSNGRGGGNDAGRGGQRGGRGNSGRERPNF